MKTKIYSGSCLCGSVRFKIKSPLGDVWFCHCEQCRKNYGMYGAFIGVSRKFFSLKGAKSVRWYRSSTKTKRGFCVKCGSPIAWDRKTSGNIYVLAGLINGKLKLKRGRHIFVGSKGGYYRICDSLPRFKTVPK